MILKGNILNRLFVDYSFYVFNVVALISAFLFKVRAGAVCAIVILISFYFCFKNAKRDDFDALFVLYLFFNAFSIFWYAFNGENMSLYFAGISYNLIPSLFFLIGYKIDKNSIDKLLNTIFCSNFIITIIGLSLFLINKSLYFTYMDTEFSYSYSYAHKFGSYLTCLVFGSMSVLQVGLIIYRLLKKQGDKITMISIPITLYALLLNMERGAWLATLILIFVVFFMLLFDKYSFKNAIKLVAVVLFLAASGYLFISKYLDQGTFLYFTSRLDRTDEVFSSRSDQMDNAIAVFYRYPLGYGLGAAGNKAALNGGSRIVPDGNYFRILVEIGVVGFGTFIMLLARGIWRGVKGSMPVKILSAAVIACSAHASGSNVFDFFYSSYIFWFLLGVISKPMLKPVANQDAAVKLRIR